jgi:hypothetical protein
MNVFKNLLDWSQQDEKTARFDWLGRNRPEP